MGVDAGGTHPRGVVVRFSTPHGRLLMKRQLAAELGRSTRWVELRLREGLPVLPRRSPAEHARFDLEAVRAWLESRSDERAVSIEQRVARLERELATLAAALNRSVT